MRFDYVKYDEQAVGQQVAIKDLMTALETRIDSFKGNAERASSLAIISLEECYMWIGKAIRDDQVARNGSAPLQD